MKTDIENHLKKVKESEHLNQVASVISSLKIHVIRVKDWHKEGKISEDEMRKDLDDIIKVKDAAIARIEEMFTEPY